ncbi:unnamed protein product [Hydatigera taeniaeformis]|uniref:Ubiquitin carboxyl-terminal hydrolase n=1 Tax=Hydatigena taeniaeformis TaxID=6205 RepID=A0A0R3WKY7_HYDTA|nr:unnamed protein product [Hydatigera taeniaeformis]
MSCLLSPGKSKQAPASKQTPTLSPSRHRGRSSSSSSKKVSTLRTVYIDSSLKKGRRNPHDYPTRSQSLVNYPSKSLRDRQDRSHRGRSSRRTSFRYCSGSRDGSSSSSRSSGVHGKDVSPVRLIKIDPRSGRSVTKEGRMFVFDSKKYKIEVLPSNSQKSEHHHHRDCRSGNWSKDGTSYVVYRGKNSHPIYLVEMEH